MKRILVMVAALAVLAPLSANAQERMSDARYLAAQECLAYAALPQLQSDGVDFTALRNAADAGGRASSIDARARQYERGVRARANTLSADELRERRDQECAGFSEGGLVRLGNSGA